MKKKNILVVLFLLCSSTILFPEKSFGWLHNGGTISYHSLGGNAYVVTLTVYESICYNMPGNLNVSYSSSCYTGGVVNVLLTDTGTISNDCRNYTSRCSGGEKVIVKKYVYEGQQSLPGVCSDWIFYYSGCCRDYTTNMQNPNGMYFKATLNNVTVPENNSPVFNSIPNNVLYPGNTTCLDMGATDADGDSLVYRLVSPEWMTDSAITYIGGLSANQPFSYFNPATLDAVTGVFCVSPDSQQVTIAGIEVDEYRNGVLIGRVVRDIHFWVVNIVSNSFASGFGGYYDYNINIPMGMEFCAGIYTSSIPHINTFLEWDSAIVGASFVIDSSIFSSGTFCWTPVADDTLNNPHCFHVIVSDANGILCVPMLGNSFTYCLTVVDSNGFTSSQDILESENSLSLSPNPFHTTATLTFNSLSSKKNLQLKIHDVMGRCVREEKVAIGNKQEIKIERGDLIDGMYFYELRTIDYELLGTGKFVVE